MDTYTADTITVDLMNISSTGCTWDPNYGAVPPVTITNMPGSGTTWTLSDSWQNSPQSSKITLEGENADIEINGVSLCDTIRGIQDRLNILCPDPEMEQEWDELKSLREAYDAKLKECREKSRTWKAIQQRG